MGKRYIGRRLLQILVVLVGVSFFTFLLIYWAPGDPVRNMYASTGTIPSEAVMDITREQLGLNDPFLVQYKNWLVGVLHGDFGMSYSLKKPVLDLMLARLWPTVRLALNSLWMMLVIAVPLGVISAVCQNRWPDTLIRGYTFLGVSMPNFWVGLILLYVIAMKLKLLPVVSMGKGYKTVIMPALTLAIAMSAKYARQIRAIVLEELHQDYVNAARCRGIRERTILWRHVFPNAMIPMVTMLGLSLGSLLGGTAVVEVIFSYQGLGNLAVKAITAMDYPVIQGYVLWVALIYMAINLLVDLSYDLLDPRVRAGR